VINVMVDCDNAIGKTTVAKHMGYVMQTLELLPRATVVVASGKYWIVHLESWCPH
jgi:hydroxylamine reductase (hybrid-cluster protein)